MNFDKTPDVGGVLVGIRGQYLIFEGGVVINLRRFTGYNIELTIVDAPEKAGQQSLF